MNSTLLFYSPQGARMTIFDTILNQMMDEPAFADAVFADASRALAGYAISAEDLARVKALTRDDFETLKSEKLDETLKLLFLHPDHRDHPAEAQSPQVTKPISQRSNPMTQSDL